MKTEDIKYLCATIGNLAGIPIRIYSSNKQIFYHSVVNLPKDPIVPYEDKILKIPDHIGYFITPRFHYYGIVNSGTYKIVLGPSRQWTANKTDLNELAFECDVPQDETENFVTAMESLVAMPLNSVLQTLCSMNFVLNGEKLSIADITIYDEEQTKLSEEITADETQKNYNETDDLSNDAAVHNTLALEQTIMNFVRHGDTAALKEWLKKRACRPPRDIIFRCVKAVKKYFYRHRNARFARGYPRRHGRKRRSFLIGRVYSEMRIAFFGRTYRKSAVSHGD